MVKKITKYLKFVVCCALIMSLVAPSYAALSASDGSAFVTKAEFDSALADFNARLTTFEAGINSKIDSQVSSYLDRNGIWNSAKQTQKSLLNNCYWATSVFDGLEFIKISDAKINPEFPKGFRQKMLRVERTTIKDGDGNDQTFDVLKEYIGAWAYSQGNWFSKGLSNRTARFSICDAISKSGALSLQLMIQRVINNQNMKRGTGYATLYAFQQLLKKFREGENDAVLSSCKNLWDPTSSFTRKFDGDSSVFITPMENWIRAYNISGNTYIKILLDDVEVQSFFFAPIMSANLFPITHDINNVTTDDPFKLGGSEPGTKIEFANGEEWTLYSGLFGTGFPLQSTEPMSLGGLVFCKKGQKLDIVVDDVFSGRNAFNAYNTILSNATKAVWTNPNYNIIDWSESDMKNSNIYANGYFLQIPSLDVY